MYKFTVTLCSLVVLAATALPSRGREIVCSSVRERSSGSLSKGYERSGSAIFDAQSLGRKHRLWLQEHYRSLELAYTGAYQAFDRPVQGNC
jgi:hypothetical protein